MLSIDGLWVLGVGCWVLGVGERLFLIPIPYPHSPISLSPNLSESFLSQIPDFLEVKIINFRH
jgi:hypothetical protein